MALTLFSGQVKAITFDCKLSVIKMNSTILTRHEHVVLVLISVS